MVVLNKSSCWLGALGVRKRGRGARWVRNDAEEAEMRGPSVRGRGDLKAAKTKAAMTFKQPHFIAMIFQQPAGFFSACPVSPVKQTGSPQGKLIVEIIQRKKRRREGGGEKKCNKRQSHVGNATC